MLQAPPVTAAGAAEAASELRAASQEASLAAVGDVGDWTVLQSEAQPGGEPAGHASMPAAQQKKQPIAVMCERLQRPGAQGHSSNQLVCCLGGCCAGGLPMLLQACAAGLCAVAEKLPPNSCGCCWLRILFCGTCIPLACACPPSPPAL